MSMMFEEQLMVLLISGICLYIIFSNYLNRDRIKFWSPLTMVSVVFIYYTIIGPLFTLSSGLTFYRLMDHRDYFMDGWKGSLISLVFILIGFNFIKRPIDKSIARIENQRLDYIRLGKQLFIIVIACIVLLVGAGGLVNQLSVVDSTSGSLLRGQGALRGYLINSINVLIGICCLFLVVYLRKGKMLIWLIFIIIFALAVFTKQGFRWRILVLGLSLASTYFIIYKKKVPLIPAIAASIAGIMIMGFIQMTRTYGTGLKLNQQKNIDSGSLLETGFGESSVFMTTGLLLANTGSKDFIGFDPLFQTIVFPIPRVLWPGKPSGDYISIYENLYYLKSDLGKGVAVLNFGEYYLMFGYPGIIVFSILLGYLFKKTWIWFLSNRDNPIAVITYTIFFGYIFVILSRGYLPQVVMIFAFTVFPMYYIFKRNSRKRQHQLSYK